MKYEQKKLERGYANRILTIDLGQGRVEETAVDPAVREYFLGGRALGLYLLHRGIDAGDTPTDRTVGFSRRRGQGQNHGIDRVKSNGSPLPRRGGKGH